MWPIFFVLYKTHSLTQAQGEDLQSAENLKSLWLSENIRLKRHSISENNGLLNRFAKSTNWEYLECLLEFLNFKPDALQNLSSLQVRKANTILSVMEGILKKMINKNMSNEALAKMVQKEKSDQLKGTIWWDQERNVETGLAMGSGQGSRNRGNQFGALQVDFLEALGMDALQVGILGEKGLRIKAWTDIPFAANHVRFLRSLIVASRFVKGKFEFESKFFKERYVYTK